MDLSILLWSLVHSLRQPRYQTILADALQNAALGTFSCAAEFDYPVADIRSVQLPCCSLHGCGRFMVLLGRFSADFIDLCGALLLAETKPRPACAPLQHWYGDSGFSWLPVGSSSTNLRLLQRHDDRRRVSLGL